MSLCHAFVLRLLARRPAFALPASVIQLTALRLAFALLLPIRQLLPAL
jgi:hypothetical protein